MAKSKEAWWKFTVAEPPPKEFVTPECFDDKEWAGYYEAEKQAVWNKKSLGKAIRTDMCSDCTLSYQHSQVLAGKCAPFYGVSTPAHRAALLISGEDEPVKKPRKSRSKPWSENGP